MSAKARLVNTCFVEDYPLGMIFFTGVFTPAAIWEYLGAWFEEELSCGEPGDDLKNCIVDLRTVDLARGTTESELRVLFENIENSARGGRVEKVALVTGLTNYHVFSLAPQPVSGERAVVGNFYSLENACQWLLGAAREALHDLDPAFGDFRHDIRAVEDTGLVVRYLSGRITAENMLEAMERLLAAPFYSRGCSVLTDCRDASFAGVGVMPADTAKEVLIRFASSLPGRSAYIFSPEDYAKSGRYAAFFAKQGLEVKPFMDLTEACAWITHEERPVLATLESMRVRQFFASRPTFGLSQANMEVFDTGPGDPVREQGDGYRDHYLYLPETNLLVRRISGFATAVEILGRTKWLEDKMPYSPGRKALLDIRDLELSQEDRLFFSQGAGGRVVATAPDTMAALCSRELLHVAEGFAAVQSSSSSALRAVTTVFSAASWLEASLPLLKHCLELLETAQRKQ